MIALTLLILSIVLTPGYSGPIKPAKLVTIPLTKSTTQGVGQYGQPVVNYYTQLSLGTPGQKFNIQFDVGYGFNFVPRISTDPKKTNLHHATGYNSSGSSTSHSFPDTTLFWYHQCQFEGQLSVDMMRLDSATTNNGVQEIRPTIEQNFLEIDWSLNARFKDLPIDGVFHIGPLEKDYIESEDIVFSLQRAELVDELLFSMWLNPENNGEAGGQLTFGGIDKSHYEGEFNWHKIRKVNSDNIWALNMEKIEFGEEQRVNSCLGDECIVVLSNGHTDIWGPTADVNYIYSFLKATHNEPSKMATLDCETVPSLSEMVFTIDAVPYTLTPNDYIKKTGDGICYVAIFPSEIHYDNWVLGSNFLSKYYTVFDVANKKVGFATAK